MKAKKSFGQHFLKEESIARHIVESLICLDDYQDIVEIGPGKGVLTKYLLEKDTHQLHPVELDRDMIEYLQINYPQLQNKIISQDFLSWNIKADLQDKPFGLIGNFPYNISSQILFRLLEHRGQIPEMVGMFQKEVAQRVASKKDCKAYGILSVLIQTFYDVEYLFTVKGGSFIPPPKVLSGVIRLIRKKDVSLSCSEKLYRSVVKTAFGMRRKMLRNSMKPFLPKDILQEDSFFKQRPENLSVKDYIVLTNRIELHRKNKNE